MPERKKQLFTLKERRVILSALDYMWGDTVVAAEEANMELEEYEKVLKNVEIKVRNT